MTNTIQLRRGTAAAWTSTNPVLAAGEQGYETDTGKIKYGDGTTAWASLAYPGGGAVSTVSVVSANGFAGSVATATTTPAITLSTSVTGILKGNGTSISAATSGTDYAPGTSALATGILKSTITTGALTIAVAGDFPTLNQSTSGTSANVTGTVAVANGGTGATSASAALTALGAVATGASNTFTGAQIGGVTTLTSSSGSVAVNLALDNNFSLAMTENTTLANPSNVTAGQSGVIALTQNASTAKTLAFGSYWIEAGTGSAPSISTTLSAQNLLSYYVFDSTHIYYTLLKHGVA